MVVEASNVAPVGEQDRDRVTPHKIAVLVLIKEFCTVKAKLMNISSIKPYETVAVLTNQQKRDMAITLLKLIQNPDIDLKKLNDIVYPIMHPKTHSLFIEKLQGLRSTGISVLMDYFTSLETLIVDPVPCSPVVHKSSFIGLFIRRMLLAFDKLSFGHVTKLYKSFCSYYDAAFKDSKVPSTSLDESAVLHVADEEEKSEDSDLEDNQVFASQKQAELFIAQQVSLLQINEKEALAPPELQQKIRELLKGNPALTEAHYLSFMNSLRVKEFCGAVENLYHHFDRNTSVPVDSKASATSDEASCAFRYAALNLAILHARFGHKEIAMAALKEAIMVSQEVNDNVCLQHALVWYYRLAPEKDENTEALIERSISKAPEFNLWYLASLGVQYLAKMKCVTTAVPSSIFDLVMKSDILNCQHSMTDVMGCAYAQKAAMWVHYGNYRMANLVSQMLLYLNTAGHVRGGVYHVGEGTCLALRNVAQVLAQENVYHLSSAVLAFAKELFPSHSEFSHIWKLCDLMSNFDKSLYAGKWVDAEKLVHGIEILDPREASYRKAQLAMGRGDMVSAHSLIKEMVSFCENERVSPHYHVRALLLRASLLLQTPNNSMASSTLMTCLEMCKTHYLMHLEAQTMMLLANYQLSLGLPKLAIRTLDGIFVTILAQGSVYDKASCYLLYARCTAATVTVEMTEECRTKVLLKAAGMCEKSVDHFVKMMAYHKAKYAYCWLAQLYNSLRIFYKRNHYAHLYRVLDQQHPCTNWNGVLIP